MKKIICVSMMALMISLLQLGCTLDANEPIEANKPNSDSVSTGIDTPIIIDVLLNDEVMLGSTLNVTFIDQGSYGSVSINGDNTITYSPYVGFNGEDSFRYGVNDGNGSTVYTEVFVTVTPLDVELFGAWRSACIVLNFGSVEYSWDFDMQGTFEYTWTYYYGNNCISSGQSGDAVTTYQRGTYSIGNEVTTSSAGIANEIDLVTTEIDSSGTPDIIDPPVLDYGLYQVSTSTNTIYIEFDWLNRNRPTDLTKTRAFN